MEAFPTSSTRTKRVPAWRVAALVAVLGNATFNVYAEWASSTTSREVSDTYANLFTPAQYATSFCALVVASFLTFCVASLLPSQRDNSVYDRLAVPLVGINVAATAWLVAFHAHALALALALMVALLVLAMDAFSAAHRAIREREIGLYASAPFSLALGSVCVGLATNVTALLVSFHVKPFTDAAETAAMVVIGVGALLASFVAARFDDFVFPTVIGWATFALVVAHRFDAPNVGLAGLFAALICGSATIGAARELFARRVVLTALDPVPDDAAEPRSLRPTRREGPPPPEFAPLRPRDSWI